MTGRHAKIFEGVLVGGSARANKTPRVEAGAFAGMILWRLVAISAVAAIAAATTAAAVAPAASTTAAASTEATASAAASSTAAPSAAVLAGPGFIDGESAPTVLLAVEGLNGSIGFAVVRHFDEPKALAAARVPIIDDLGG